MRYKAIGWSPAGTRAQAPPAARAAPRPPGGAGAGPGAGDPARRARFHLRLGFWLLLGFLSLGLVLEALHGFKVPWYLSAANERRRELFTLAHAHGTLLALLNVVFGLRMQAPPAWPAAPLGLASRCLVAATLLLPGGFLLGGAFIYAGDPGPGILLVPLGALLLFAAVLLAARSLGRPGPP
jgi:hypothetical protein